MIVGTAAILIQNVRHALQQEVAVQVSVKVVHEFETVQIHQHQGERSPGLGTRAAFPFPGERFHEEAMRLEASEAVRNGLFLRFFGTSSHSGVAPEIRSASVATVNRLSSCGKSELLSVSTYKTPCSWSACRQSAGQLPRGEPFKNWFLRGSLFAIHKSTTTHLLRCGRPCRDHVAFENPDDGPARLCDAPLPARTMTSLAE